MHCGDLGHPLSENTINAIGEVDILCVPVGGIYSITAAAAMKVVNEIEPIIIIPMHYQQAGLDQSIFAQLQSVDAFVKEISTEGVQPVDKLTIKKESLSLDEQRVVVMSI